MPEVIQRKRHRNLDTGATASIYGAVPWRTDAERERWVTEPDGWTVRWDCGRVGAGRYCATRAEAQAIIDRHADHMARFAVRQGKRGSDAL